MEITIHSPNVDLTDMQKNYINEKVSKLERFAERVDDESTQIKVEVDKNKVKGSSAAFSCQVTMLVPRAVIRAEVIAHHIEEAIDLVVDKLQRQIERYKGKQNRRDKTGKWIPTSTLEEISQEEQFLDEMSKLPKIVKRKRFSKVVPMHEEEAIEAMELIGHTFYLFLNAATNRFSVVYKRTDDTYGLIEPKLPEDES